MASNGSITLYDLRRASGCTIGSFVWPTTTAPVATTPPLTEDDRLRDWLDVLQGQGFGTHQPRPGHHADARRPCNGRSRELRWRL